MLGRVSPARVLRAVVVLLADAVSLVVLSALLPGFELDGPGAAHRDGRRDRHPERARLAGARALHAAAQRHDAGPRHARPQRRADRLRDRSHPGRRHQGLLDGSRRGPRHRAADDDARLPARGRRGRVLVPKRRAPPGEAPRRSRGERRPGRDLPRDRRARARGAPARDARRERADARALAARRQPPLRPLGDRLVVADRRLPGRPTARQQRRHARLSVVGEGPRDVDRHESSPRRRGARAAALGRARAAARGRGEPRQHPVRRRHPLDAHDEHRAAAPRADRARLPRVLRKPVRGRAHAHARARRDRAASGARRRSSAGATSSRASPGTARTRWCAPGRRSCSAISRLRPSSAT